jgi:bifunctional enzyme CysN/CysC
LPATSEHPHGLLRLTTAGSVDDGKSTLIGRLLYDSRSILADQLEQVEDASRRRNGNGGIDLSLLTDGLRAEREQGITIDVAYRYFATARRKFIIADAPGHEQYTRNMVTGASTADLAVLLVDARKGVVEQTRRHAFLSSLLGIPRVVAAVNKMDLVGYDEAAFDRIVRGFCDFAQRLGFEELAFVPISALHGDNVVARSEAMPWYAGPPLLEHLETVEVACARNLEDLRFPVQWVIRPTQAGLPGSRGYAGQIAGGVLKVGDEVTVQPSGLTTRVAAIETFDGPLEEAWPPLSVTLRLEDEVDVSRGDMICRAHDGAAATRELEAMVCWLSERPLLPAGRYGIKHTTRAALARVDELRYRLDVNTLDRDEAAGSLALNETGRVRLRLSAPLLVDDYRRNRATGSFILIDESTNDTVGAGMVIDAGEG